MYLLCVQLPVVNGLKERFSGIYNLVPVGSRKFVFQNIKFSPVEESHRHPDFGHGRIETGLCGVIKTFDLITWGNGKQTSLDARRGFWRRPKPKTNGKCSTELFIHQQNSLEPLKKESSCRLGIKSKRKLAGGMKTIYSRLSDFNALAPAIVPFRFHN